MAEVQQDQGPKAPISGDQFPCEQCGAKLRFKPGSDTIKCDHCGHANPIPKRPWTQIEEQDHAVGNFLQKCKPICNGQKLQRVIQDDHRCIANFDITNVCTLEAHVDLSIAGDLCQYAPTSPDHGFGIIHGNNSAAAD
jgi:hypothetical protein